MRKPTYTVRLKAKELKELKKLIKSGTEKARTITRARILLFAHQKKSNEFIKEALNISTVTIVTIKKRFREGRLPNALYEKKRPGKPSIFSGRTKAKITALACTKAPNGRGHWSLRLLADKAVELEYVDHIGYSSIRRILKKTT